MSQTKSTSRRRPDPERWLLDNLPRETVAGVQFVHLDTGSGHSTQFFSVEWLAEEFGEIIRTADHPKQQLLSAGSDRGPGELRRLFEQLDEPAPEYDGRVASD